MKNGRLISISEFCSQQLQLPFISNYVFTIPAVCNILIAPNTSVHNSSVVLFTQDCPDSLSWDQAQDVSGQPSSCHNSESFMEDLDAGIVSSVTAEVDQHVSHKIIYALERE